MEKVSRRGAAAGITRGEQVGVASEYRLHVRYTEGLPFGWARLGSLGYSRPLSLPSPLSLSDRLSLVASLFFMPYASWLMAHALCHPGRPAPTMREILASPFAAGDGPPVTRCAGQFHAAKTVFYALYCLIRDVRNGTARHQTGVPLSRGANQNPPFLVPLLRDCFIGKSTSRLPLWQVAGFCLPVGS